MEGMGQPHQVRNQQPQYDNAGASSRPTNNNQARKWYQPTLESKLLVVLVITAVVLVFGSFVAGTFSSAPGQMRQVKQDQYQAVFLTNGQVYFGKVTGLNSETMVLEDIYYLQVEQQLQPEQEGLEQEPQISLAKLGEELHGPEDVMFINFREVVFWENLKEEGQVVQAIRQFQQNGAEGGELQGQQETVPGEDQGFDDQGLDEE